jgi:hypothetical protein
LAAVAARKEKVRMKQKEWRCGESNPGPLTYVQIILVFQNADVKYYIKIA